MKNNHHFLDTKIILATILENDNCYNDVKNYLNFDCTHYISNTAIKEAKFKINNDKRIFLELVDFIKNFAVENYIDFLKLDKCIFDIEKSFLKLYDGMEFPENMPQKRFQRLIKSFFIIFFEEITKILIDEDNSYFKKLITDTNLLTLSNLEIFLQKYNCISFIESGNFIESLKEIGIDNKDSILIDESYYLSVTLRDSVNFITFDKGILKFKNKIFEIISQCVVVSSPIEFVSVKN